MTETDSLRSLYQDIIQRVGSSDLRKVTSLTRRLVLVRSAKMIAGNIFAANAMARREQRILDALWELHKWR